MRRQRQKNKKKIILGVTGSFGSGKTTVARLLGRMGACVIDADMIAHRVIKPGKPAYKEILKRFGAQVLKKGGSIDRRKLAKVVFSDKRLLHKLNDIVHPRLISVIKKRIVSCGGRVLVLDAPLLIEAGLENIVDKLIVVKASKAQQIKRIRSRSGLSGEEIKKRIAAQVSLKDKIPRADFVIDNNGTIQKTKKQVQRLGRLLWKS